MAFDLNIKNIGKLPDAKIRIGQFTVLSGPNNTGKSYVSKLLYSLFNTMNANHAEVYMKKLTDPIKRDLQRLMLYIEPDNENLNQMLIEIDKLEDAVKQSPVGDHDELNKIIPHIADGAQNMHRIFKTFHSFLNVKQNQKSLRLPFRSVDRVLEGMEKSMDILQKNIKDTNAKNLIISGIAYKVQENLIQNFQIPQLSNLQREQSVLSEIELVDSGTFKILDGRIDFAVTQEALRQLQQLSRVIYIESPVYWKLKNALDNLKPDHGLFQIRRALSGVPGYFYDLASYLRYEYTGEMAFPDLYEKLTSEKVLGGKVTISETGDLAFSENGRNFSLSITAMGVANLGMLALLIERKILDEDSFLFVDEPEAHLHPAWQVIMAETLFELAKSGVNVVIATHSADILKWLEVHIKKNPDDEKLVALNKFPPTESDLSELDFTGQIAAIKRELTKPFADLYTAGL